MWHEYPYTDSHELNLDWFLKEFKTLVETWEQVQSDWNSLHDYVQNYFDNLNVQTEINNKINAMMADGSFALILTPLVEAALPTIVDGKLPAVVASQIGAVVASQIDAVVAGQLPVIAAAAAAQEVGNWLAANIDPDTGYVIDKTLTVSDAAADAKITGDVINYIGDQLKINHINMKAYIDADGVVTSSPSMYMFYCYEVTPGEIIHTISAPNAIVYGFFTSKPVIGSVTYNSSRTTITSGTTHGVNVPATCTWIGIRTAAADNLTFIKNHILLSDINNTMQHDGSYDIITDRYDQSSNDVDFTWNSDFTICTVNGTATAATFNNLFVNDYWPDGITAGDYIHLRYTTTDPGVKIKIFFRPLGINAVYDGDADILLPAGCTGGVIRLDVANGVTVNNAACSVNVYPAKSNKELTKDVANLKYNQYNHLKILFVGNSYTNDCTSYLPFIFNDIAKKTRITVGTSYYAGARIDDYVDFFDNDSAVLTYYKYVDGTSAWTSAGSKTIKQIVADEAWDIIVFQQSSNHQGTWSTYANLNSLIDKIVGYYVSQHNRSVKLGWMFPQLRYSVIDTVTFESVITCVENLLETTPIQFFFPCGTAVQNARGTTLDNVGDSSHLCADANGHLQEGLPVQLASYVAALKLLEFSGEDYMSVLGDTLRPDQAWVTAIASPGQNGTCTGVSDANCYLAQKCAIASIKFPTTISTIS